MHAYATDVDRNGVPIILALIAIGATLLFLYVIQTLKIIIPWWIDAPSVMGFYGIFYKLYDRVLWKQHFGPIYLSMIPDVSGIWAGVLKSSYNEGTKIDIVFKIKQTWSKIKIETETETSKSSTTMAALFTDESHDPRLAYEYLSTPKVFAVKTMNPHLGTGHLELSPAFRILTGKGDYYTGRGRQTLGELDLHFVSKKSISYEEALKRLTLEQVSNGN